MIPGRYPSYFVYKSNSGHSCSLFDVIWYPNGSERCGSKIGYFAFQDMCVDRTYREEFLRKIEEIILEHVTCPKELPVVIGKRCGSWKGVPVLDGEYSWMRV
jgi:hypothetical protein